jgi:hypothetical protein
VDTTPILTAPWPHNLDPAIVPFAKRTATVIERQGIYTNPTLLNNLTTTDVLGWWNAGPYTVEDLCDVGNDAIRRHHEETGLLEALEADLSNMASEPWAPHIWHHDPRFARFVPKGDLTVYEIATAGSTVDRRFLWEHRTGLRDAVDTQAKLSLLDAVAQYVEAVSGQHGDRLDALLARTGLNGSDPINGTDAARRLGISHQRMYQIVQQLHRAKARARPSAGIWMHSYMRLTRHAGRSASQQKRKQRFEASARATVSDAWPRHGAAHMCRDA